MNREKIKQLGLPESPGSYQFLDKAGKIIYIGKAVNLKNRVLSYWQAGANLTPAKQQLITKVERIKWITTDSEIEALLLEANLVKKYQPYYNVDLRDDKRFVYIKVALADEVPGVLATRKIDKSGQYFGPFVSTVAVRETLKAIRKIWPYCTQRKVGREPCFYYQIGRCLGVCGGKISLAQYKRQVIKPIIEFLEGKKGKIIKNLESGILNLEKRAKKFSPPTSKISPSPYQGEGRGGVNGGQPASTRDRLSMRGGEGVLNELAKLKWQLKNMEQVLANTRVLSTAEKYSSDVVELAKVLALPQVPQRIEGYDLSNIFGQEAVGSMVVFAGGEPDKNEYRKFKIKLSSSVIPAQAGIQGHSHPSCRGNPVHEKIDNRLDTRRSLSRTAIRGGYDSKRGDVQMLEEVLIRRFHNDWPLPDLIVVDGGKAQLNVALKVLKQYKLDIPVLGISKGEGLRSSIAPDKIFFPNQKLPLQLSLNSPTLHLLKRVRDEAHRFAITYHRQLRSRSFLGKI